MVAAGAGAAAVVAVVAVVVAVSRASPWGARVDWGSWNSQSTTPHGCMDSFGGGGRIKGVR
jgi:hypothetical protein